MKQLANDLKDESFALYQLISEKTEQELALPSKFKQWTTNDIIRHLHIWNVAAEMSIYQPEKFEGFIQQALPFAQKGELRTFEAEYLKNLSGLALVKTWHDFYVELTNKVAKEDPKRRVKWAGPSMSIRSSITARLMETWSHSQAIYDLFNQERIDTDRIKNIVILGINTFGWTYKNRKQSVPEDVPNIVLSAPSGETWQWNEDNSTDKITGSASEFCQVVTQCRNIDDTKLAVSGDIAHQWMSIAQCFAGPVETPPSKGVRQPEAIHT